MPTFTRWQIFLTGQVEQIGEIGLQTFCPQVTSRALYSIQYFRGNFFLKANSVSSGVRVSIYPRRLEMRCTWVSTHIPGLPNPSVKTRLAVLRPTPLSVKSNSRSSGTFESKRWINSSQISWIRRALV